MSVLGPFAADAIRTIDTVQAEPEAMCSDCGWHREGATGGQWLAIRAAARRHAEGHGHVVLAGVRTSYLYATRPGR